MGGCGAQAKEERIVASREEAANSAEARAQQAISTVAAASTKLNTAGTRAQIYIRTRTHTRAHTPYNRDNPHMEHGMPAAGDPPPVGESGEEEQGSWAVVKKAMANAKHAAAVKKQITAPNHDKASSLKR